MPAHEADSRRTQIIQASRQVPAGRWTTYAVVSEIVYGHPKAAQTVGTVMREEGRPDSAHRVLRSGGEVASEWTGLGGGPEECIRRLRAEGSWDETRNLARADRCVDAAELRKLQRRS